MQPPWEVPPSRRASHGLVIVPLPLELLCCVPYTRLSATTPAPSCSASEPPVAFSVAVYDRFGVAAPVYPAPPRRYNALRASVVPAGTVASVTVSAPDGVYAIDQPEMSTGVLLVDAL